MVEVAFRWIEEKYFVNGVSPEEPKELEVLKTFLYETGLLIKRILAFTYHTLLTKPKQLIVINTKKSNILTGNLSPPGLNRKQ